MNKQEFHTETVKAMKTVVDDYGDEETQAIALPLLTILDVAEQLDFTQEEKQIVFGARFQELMAMVG